MSERATMQISMDSRQIHTDTLTVPGHTIITVPVTNRAYRRKNRLTDHKPDDFSDVAQAEVFVAEFGDVIRWTPGIGFLVYDGQKWRASDSDARDYSQKLTDIQKTEARKAIHDANDQVMYAKEHGNESLVKAANAALDQAQRYFNYVISQRKSPRITATLTEAEPKVSIEIDDLDNDAFLLNTPTGTVDLRTGVIKDHDPDDLCTHITAVGPSEYNKEIFDTFLKKLTCDDQGLQDYLQEVAGMCAIGKVFTEAFFLCHGPGGNGKTTFFKLLERVLGDYATDMPSNALTTSFDERVALVLNERLHGKRLALYPELEAGNELNTAAIKKIASVDRITVNPKYRDTFSFEPSHTPILFTNPLPKVSSMDAGTWDRLILIPFRARFRNTSTEIKNYADVLFDQCGGYVLQWIIEGAKRFIKNGCKLTPPDAVVEATKQFHAENDWFYKFQMYCCVVGDGYSTTATELYNAYSEYCRTILHIDPYNQTYFGKAYGDAGFTKKRTKNGIRIEAIQVKTDWMYTPVSMPVPFTDQLTELDDEAPF